MGIRFRGIIAFGCAWLALTATSWAQDWPQWRSDAGHTATCDAELPAQLQLIWKHDLGPRKQAWPDPLNQDMMQYDRIFEPVAKDGRLYVNFNDTDKVMAFDGATGAPLWTYYTDGPVRFPAVAWQDVVFFGSDDGHLYCVDAASGALRWKFRAAPSDWQIIGNERLISAWPVRGAPVVFDDQIYFAASIWPFMGTFIYCLDAKTGSLVWENDGSASTYIKQPHSANAFAGVAPQGIFTVSGDTLLIPGGRSVPAAYDRRTGQVRHYLLDEGGKANGGALVIARGAEYFVHTRVRGVRVFDLATGNKGAFTTNEPVLDTNRLYAAEVIAAAAPAEGASAPAPVPVLKAYRANKEVAWELPGIDGTGDLIRAGSRLYAAGGGKLTALELSLQEAQPARVAWQIDAPAAIQRLLAAGDRLYAVTLGGSIYAYGAARPKAGATQPSAGTEPNVASLAPRVPRPTPSMHPAIDALTERCGAKSGYLVWYGEVDETTVDQLLAHTQFDLVLVHPAAERVAALRATYDRAGVYGSRCSIHQGTPATFRTPPYVAHLVVVAGSAMRQLQDQPDLLPRVYASVRPFGGCLVGFESPSWPSLADDATSSEGTARPWVAQWKALELEQANIVSQAGWTLVQRVGPLPGSADWTHQYGNVANTVKSNDARVRMPLGLLWFGGSSNLDVLPRHGHGPPEQVIGGRLFVEGMDCLSCRDVYTGRVLWKRTFSNLGTFGVYFDTTYKNTPLDPAYNQVHIPGATGRGTNYVATEDAVYLIEDSVVHVLDARTGETRRTIELPEKFRQEGRKWGYIGIYQDVLLGGAGFANFKERHAISFEEEDAKLGDNSKGYGSRSLDTAASVSLVAFDRHTGDVLWQTDAQHSFLHNGIVAGDGRVYCLDRLPTPVEDKLKRRGQARPETYRIVSIDARSGEKVWEQVGQITGTWLGYSEEHHVLLHAGASANDRLESEVGRGMVVFRGETGETVWRDDQREYSGPCILHHDTILTNAMAYRVSAGAFSLLDGKPKLIKNPLTNQEHPWQLVRTYGCDSIVASENMLTFRSGAAGVYDLATLSGTANLGGFKSSCSGNLIVANGVLNAPDYTRTCSCGYQNQTSLALIHFPEMEMWTVNHTSQLTQAGQQLSRLGINFGAPGDRVDTEGTLWIDYPVVGGDTFELDVQVAGAPSYYRHHSLRFQGPAPPWIGASGIQNASRITIPLQVKRQPGEVKVAVQKAEDDAEEQPDGTVSLTSSDLELVTDEASQTVGLRFDKVAIPPGRKILSAHIQFTCDETTDAEAKLNVTFEDVAHAAPFVAEAKNLSGRAKLDGGVAWTVPAWSKEGQASDKERSPDVTAMVQSLVNRPDWVSENAMAVVLTGEGKRVAKAADGGTAGAATLVIRVDEPPPPPPPATPHTVRLYFAEPDDRGTAERVFDVQLEGQVVETDFRIAQAADGPRRTIVREYSHVMLSDRLTIDMLPKQGETVLSGVEIIRETTLP